MPADMYCYSLLLFIICSLSVVVKSQVKQLSYAMQEERPVGWVVADLSLAVRMNRQYANGEKLEFALLPQSGDFREYFLIEKDTGLLKVKNTINRDVLAPNAENYVVTLQAALVRPDFEPYRILINIDDVNDNSPVFPDARYVLAVSESSAAGKTFPLPHAVDPDSPPFSIQEYRLLSNSSLFTLKEVRTEGLLEGIKLELRHTLDRETMPRASVRVLAVDGGSPSRTGTLTVDIVVTDSNDHSPVFDSDLYEVTIFEDTAPGIVIATVHAVDADDGLNAQVTYALSALTQKQFGNVFSVDNKTGEISLLARLRYDLQNSYALSLDARDLGLEPLSGRTKVVVNLIDVNDHSPEITLNPWGSGEKIEVLEEEAAGTYVAMVYVEDKDSGVNGDVTCSVDTKLLALTKVDTRYYKVVTSAPFDREAKDDFSVLITCTDRGNPAKSASKEFSMKIKDANDNAPKFDQDVYTATVAENMTGIELITVRATDLDTGANARISYHIPGPMGHYFSVDEKSGRVRVKSGLDYERFPTAQLTIQAMDDGKPRRSSTALVLVDLTDVNDEAPSFHKQAYVFHVMENAVIGTAIGHVNATDRDGSPFNGFVFSLNNGDSANGSVPFAVHPTSGLLSVRRSLDREAQAAYAFPIIATDLYEPYWNSSVNVVVYVDDLNDNAPVLSVRTNSNETNVIQVPSSARKGFTIAEIIGKDYDHGHNSRLTFTLHEDMNVEEGYFRIHPFTGVLAIDKDVAPLSGKTLRLNVTAQDAGAIPLKDTIELLVVINSSLWLEAVERSPHRSSALGFFYSLRYHEMIIVMLTAVTAVLVTILVTSIICLKVKQQRRLFDKTHRYNCRDYDSPEPEVAIADEYVNLRQDGVANVYESSSAIERYPMIKTPVHGYYHPNDITTQHYHANFGHSQSSIPQAVHAAPPVVWGQNLTVRSKDTLSPPEKSAAMAAEDSDSVASATSVNDSNTDSGRGGSEEGEAGRRVPITDGMNHLQPQGNSRVVSSFLPKPQHPKTILLAHEQALNSLSQRLEQNNAADEKTAAPSREHNYPPRNYGQQLDDNGGQRSTLDRKPDFQHSVSVTVGCCDSTSGRQYGKFVTPDGKSGSLRIVNV